MLWVEVEAELGVELALVLEYWVVALVGPFGLVADQWIAVLARVPVWTAEVILPCFGSVAEP